MTVQTRNQFLVKSNMPEIITIALCFLLPHHLFKINQGNLAYIFDVNF